MDLCDVQLIYWIYTWSELKTLDIGKFCFSLLSFVVVGLEITLVNKISIVAGYIDCKASFRVWDRDYNPNQ